MKRLITQEQFDLVRPLLEGARRKTRPRKHDLYDVLCAILHRTDAGIPWRALPAEFPAWRTVHEYNAQWSMAPRGGGTPVLAQVLAILEGGN